MIISAVPPTPTSPPDAPAASAVTVSEVIADTVTSPVTGFVADPIFALSKICANVSLSKYVMTATAATPTVPPKPTVAATLTSVSSVLALTDTLRALLTVPRAAST